MFGVRHLFCQNKTKGNYRHINELLLLLFCKWFLIIIHDITSFLLCCISSGPQKVTASVSLVNCLILRQRLCHVKTLFKSRWPSHCLQDLVNLLLPYTRARDLMIQPYHALHNIITFSSAERSANLFCREKNDLQ